MGKKRLPYNAILLFALTALVCCQGPIQSGESNPPTDAVDLATITGQLEIELKAGLIKDSVGGSISVAIVKDDKIIWSKAFGYADGENQIIADTTTIYRAGSISKSFTAFLMMQLVDDGIISLDDPVEKYLPEIKQLTGYSPATRITFLELASHTSGLSREPQLNDANAGAIGDWERKVLASIPMTQFESVHGTKYSYSNIGFGILGLALSRAANKPFMQMMQERIFDPLKMTHTFYVVPDEMQSKLAVGMEPGQSGDVDTESPRTEHRGRGYKVPNGGIYSTPNDLAKFMINNLGYGALLEKKSRDLMQTEKGPTSNKYGLGFMVFHNDQVEVVGHNGQVLGYTAQFAFERQSRFGMILMRNYTWGAIDLDKTSFLLLSKLKQLYNN